MTLILETTDDDKIALPSGLMELINLKEEDQVKIIIEGQVLSLIPFEQFLFLQGVLQNDTDFDVVIEFLNQRSQSWKS